MRYMKADRTVRLVTIDEKKQWNSIASHPLQSWEWGEFRAAMGLDVIRLGVFEKNKLVQVWQMTFHPIPHTPFTVGYFPKGPTPTEEMLKELQIQGQKKHAVYIQMEPDTLAEEAISVHPKAFVPSHRPLFTKYTF